jgi:predicted TIM-barrel enzyme
VVFTLDDTAAKVMEMAEAAWSINPDQMVICQGGPFNWPENVGTALKKTRGVIGFFGASSIERLPTEQAIQKQVEGFKGLTLS